jgi:hypothetical protein
MICAATPSLAHSLSPLCIIQLQGGCHDNTTKQEQILKLKVPHHHALQIGPLSQMRYHWKPMVFYFYVGMVTYQFNGL